MYNSNITLQVSYNFSREWQDGSTHEFPIPGEWQDGAGQTHGGFIMVATFSMTTWSLQRVSQMEHKDMLHATYRLKIAIKDISS
jgi:hypothetical protein